MAKLPPTYEEESAQNKEQFMTMLRACDPDLYMIKLALDESRLNLDPMTIPQIVRTLGNLMIGTGYGKVTLFMQASKITNIDATEKIKLGDE